MKKRAFESLSRDFSSFKNIVVSLTNLCQGQLKISRVNAKLPRKPRNRKRNTLKWPPSDVTPLAPITTFCLFQVMCQLEPMIKLPTDNFALILYNLHIITSLIFELFNKCQIYVQLSFIFWRYLFDFSIPSRKSVSLPRFRNNRHSEINDIRGLSVSFW